MCGTPPLTMVEFFRVLLPGFTYTEINEVLRDSPRLQWQQQLYSRYMDAYKQGPGPTHQYINSLKSPVTVCNH